MAASDTHLIFPSTSILQFSSLPLSSFTYPLLLLLDAVEVDLCISRQLKIASSLRAHVSSRERARYMHKLWNIQARCRDAVCIYFFQFFIIKDPRDRVAVTRLSILIHVNNLLYRLKRPGRESNDEQEQYEAIFQRRQQTHPLAVSRLVQELNYDRK